jgi:GDP-D-mannose dehydratase
MRILITGITGFVGSHLAEYILGLKQEHQIYGICRWRSSRDNLANIYGKVVLLESDLTDLSGLIRNTGKVKPDVIFHLAAQSYVP